MPTPALAEAEIVSIPNMLGFTFISGPPFSVAFVSSAITFSLCSILYLYSGFQFFNLIK